MPLKGICWILNFTVAQFDLQSLERRKELYLLYQQSGVINRVNSLPGSDSHFLKTVS